MKQEENTTEINQILSMYAVGSPIQTSEILLGNVNRIFRVRTTNGKYIVKRLDYYDKVNHKYRQEVLFDLDKLNVKIPLPLRNISGKYITELNNNMYEMTNYIPHKKKQIFNMQDFRQLGTILAEIHKLPFSNYKLEKADYCERNKWIKEKVNLFTSDYNMILKNAQGQDTKTAQTVQTLYKFLQITETKRNNLLENKELLDTLSTGYSFTHGDFHSNNILQESTTGDLYLIDWDQLKVRPRLFEIQRSVHFLCGERVKSDFYDALNKTKAVAFLEGYSSVFKISKNDINPLILLAEYFANAFFLISSLGGAIEGDFRVIKGYQNPSIDSLLWWNKNINTYRELLSSLILN